MSQTINTKIIITDFTNLIDINKKYTCKELLNILNKVYNDVNKITKKVPTKYNLYVKDNMTKTKKEFPDYSRQDLMRKIGERWKLEKNSDIEEKNSDIEKKKSDIEENNLDIEENNSDIEKKNSDIEENNLDIEENKSDITPTSKSEQRLTKILLESKTKRKKDKK